MALKRSIVVVGLGSIGRRHARLLKARGDLEVRACEPDEATAGLAFEQFGEIPLYTSYDEALASGPDTVNAFKLAGAMVKTSPTPANITSESSR